MPRSLSVLLSQLAVTIEDAQTTLPLPTIASDGASIAGWASGPYFPLEGELKLTAGGAVVLSGAEIYEWDGAVWCSLGLLNAGNDITLSATRGFKHPIYGPVGTRLAVAATLSAAVAVTAVATPREVIGG